MDDYIGKGALYDALWDAKQEKKVKSLKDVFDFIDKFPVKDVVSVVRCKDCKYYKAQKQSVNWKNKKKYCCRVVALKVNENDYCSYGERKCE